MKLLLFSVSWRANLLRLGILWVALVLFLRLFYLQIVNHQRFVVLAERQHNLSLPIPAERGEIISSDGFPLATNEQAYLVYAVPPEIDDKKQTAGKLAEVLIEELRSEQEQRGASLRSGPGTDQLGDRIAAEDKKQTESKRIEELLSLPDRFWVAIAHKISFETKKKVEELNLPGIYFEKEQKRVYPEGSLAAHVLGFVGKNESGEDWGYYGLEGYYEGDLAGKEGWLDFEKDVSGRPIPVSEVQRVAPTNGRTLVLTLRRNLQYLLEKKLAEGVKRYGAENGIVIVMEPATGRILAMAKRPTYDPQNWAGYLSGQSDVAKVEIFRNQAISQNYEPGSVFKPVTMSAALQTKTVTPEVQFDDVGPLEFSGYQVRTWDNKYHGWIDMAQILQLSSNTGAAWLAHQVGVDNFAKFLQKFNLGQKTGIDLEGEDAGIIREKKEWRDIDLANMGFGQGIAVTPIQLTAIYSAIANGGKLMRPYLVEKILKPDGSQIEISPRELGRPINQETAYTLQEMLQSVIDKGEFKWFVKQSGLNRYELAGKTGTAQIPEGGRYNPNKTEVTFVGFAPTHNPKFVMLVKLSKPTTSTYSAETAVPLWLEMAKEALVYFNIAPTR